MTGNRPPDNELSRREWMETKKEKKKKRLSPRELPEQTDGRLLSGLTSFVTPTTAARVSEEAQ